MSSAKPQPRPKIKPKERPKSDYKPTIGGRKLKKLTSSGSSTSTATPNSNSLNLSEGMNVGHVKFGKGTVVKIEGEAPNVKATIKFPAVGTKHLPLKFAKLEILS